MLESEIGGLTTRHTALLTPVQQRIADLEAALKHARAIADAERRRALALERDIRTMARLAVIR